MHFGIVCYNESASVLGPVMAFEGTLFHGLVPGVLMHQTLCTHVLHQCCVHVIAEMRQGVMQPLQEAAQESAAEAGSCFEGANFCRLQMHSNSTTSAQTLKWLEIEYRFSLHPE